MAEPAGELLKSGSVGLRSKAIQQALKDQHYDPGEPDGKFGLKTTMAVWAFQQLHGLSPDGVVGLAILIGAILALAVSLIARRLLGGYTGDVLGAIEQVFELGFVLGVAASLGVANTFSRT